ncbi:NAD-dependent epimerase/dehydratase family protein [Paenibacillus wulumuqiensis]|uniref:NAD-dependent epimerase/dehydratase family protein n=1 Tax=Paenibacillus wulumuqiensis TaxID=1567107 RepID=UPI000619F1B2|nr:NAD(P)H-binding protein [Paenibacillus wulumuqiensis]
MNSSDNRPGSTAEPSFTTHRPRIVLTGATGYIGHNMLNQLVRDYDVIALSRHNREEHNSEHVEWRACDLFSMSAADECLEGADYAIYLVHSMMPTAKLTQAKFEDMDIILADHFARAARKNGIKQIIYLSGIIPEHVPREQLSRHLRSRLEVEQVLGSYGVPVTTIRAGLIVGPQGSSFPILARLVRRLPVMTLPEWTRTMTHPIALSDVLNAIQQSIGSPQLYSRAIDVGGPDVMTYKQMMEKTAEVMHKRRTFIDIPLLTIGLSRLWVTLVTQMPREMVYPLVESLAHPMVAHADHHVPGISDGKVTFEDAARIALEQESQQQHKQKQRQHSKPKKSSATAAAAVSDVRSIQRVLMPKGKNARWAGSYYMDWLGRFLPGIVRTEQDQPGRYRLYVRFLRKPILELTFCPKRSDAERAVYYITGGAFARTKEAHEGRLEFQQISGTRECVIAIHDYLPSLPWILYKFTQAQVHLLVMHAFRRHLLRLIAADGQDHPSSASQPSHSQ